MFSDEEKIQQKKQIAIKERASYRENENAKQRERERDHTD